MVLTRYMTRSAAMVHSAIPARSSILVRLLGVTRSAAMVHSSVMPRSGILVRSAYVNSILYPGSLSVTASFRGHGALNCGDSLKPPGSFAVLGSFSGYGTLNGCDRSPQMVLFLQLAHSFALMLSAMMIRSQDMVLSR